MVKEKQMILLPYCSIVYNVLQAKAKRQTRLQPGQVFIMPLFKLCNVGLVSETTLSVVMYE